MVIKDTDKIFWLRAGIGAVTGTLTELFFGSDYQSGVLLAVVVFLASYYLVRRLWGKNFRPDEVTKLYTAGLGTYILLFLFVYILLFTFGVHYLNL